MRNTLIESLAKQDINDVSGEVVGHCAQVQKAFFLFRDAICESPSRADVLWNEHRVAIGTQEVVVDLINVAWMSTLHEQPVLQFPTKRFEQYSNAQQDLRISVFHHPLNWYAQAAYRPFRRLVRSTADIILTGHEHHVNVGENIDAESGFSAYVEGGVLFEEGSSQSTFNIVEVDLDERTYRTRAYSWNGSMYVPTEDEDEAWSSFRTLGAGNRAAFPIAAAFEQDLEDPGAQFSHPGAAVVKLSDLFVFPDLQRFDKEADDHIRQVSSRQLLNYSALAHGALIRGDEKSGRSTLLRRLFVEYHAQGKIPVLIDGRDISSGSERDTLRLIKAAVKAQYGAKYLNAFDQVSKSDKVLLIDDLDLATVGNRYLGNALTYLTGSFGGTVAAVDSAFELRELLTKTELDALHAFDEYELLEFGHARRYDLAVRWVAIGEGASSTARDTINLIDRAENILTGVLGKKLVPSYPLYLLTLLQSIEAGQLNALQNSAYGYYYQYLITSKLAELRILPEQYEEFFHYCAQLAWFFKSSQTKEIELRHLQHFHQKYCEEFVFVSFDSRLKHLTQSHILVISGEWVSFRYPYAFYFFLAKYFADRISEPEIRALVAGYCGDLALRENANIVLFLVHHTKDPFVYEQAIQALETQFAGVPPIELQSDVDVFNELVAAAPRLVFRGGDVLENRKRMREAQDEADTKLDTEEQAPNESRDAKYADTTTVASSLNRLLKTVEILGHVLRNHYGPLKRSTKQEILQHVFDGTLRGLRVLLDALAHDKDLLISQVERLLEEVSPLDRDERNAEAKRAVFVLLELIAFSFIRIAAASTGSEFLRDVIDDTVRKKNTVAYRLIGLAVELDQGRVLSIDKIRELDKEFRANPFARRQIKLLVVRFLYMYRTQEREKQQLCDELGITIASQRKIDIKSNKTKLIERK